MAPQAEEPLSLTEWCKYHIQAVFEADTNEGAVAAIDETFSKDLQATVNGVTVCYAQVKTQILDLRQHGKLRVSWKGFVESGNNPLDQDGRIGAFYLIEGIRKSLPNCASNGSAEFVRHKAVSARVVSEPATKSREKRRIVELVVIANDIAV